MTRIFIIDLAGKRCCVNATTDQQAEKYLSEGAIEVAQATVKEVFGDYSGLASPLNTEVDADGNITFTLSDFMPDYRERIIRICDQELNIYETALRKLALMIRCAEPGEELERLEGLFADWDAYAIQIMALPEHEGYPWDGGGEGSPMPVRPIMP